MPDKPGRSEEDSPPVDPAEDAEATETPFDHPLFLPLLLAGLSSWFFYDGFINQDPEMLKHLTWNRTGFAASFLATLWYGYRGWKEMRERNEFSTDDDREQPGGKSDAQQ